ncbi:WD40 repeat domain-containing protein [Photorhabdus laumondii]|uniref:WD40 repeat domain-containing protein n=1 Tax=Photorhabdus laumondii TaxID=2218628 RepID=UPI003314F18A
MHKHTSPISGVATYGNKFVLSAGYDNKVILWDAYNKRPIRRVYHDHLVNQCAFSPCGNYIATVSSDYTCRIWLLPDMTLYGIINSHTDDVESVSFHPNKNIVATCSRDKTIIVSDYKGNVIAQLKGHVEDVISVEWSSSGNLISSSDDGTIRIWDVDYQKEIECIDLDNIETDTISITPDGVIYAGNDNGEIITIINGKLKITSAHEAGIKRLVYDFPQKIMVSLSYDRKMKLWKEKDNNLESYHIAELPPIVWPRSCAFLDSDNLVFASFGDSYVQYTISTQAWHQDHVRPTYGSNAVYVSGKDIWSVGDAGIVFCNNRPFAEMGSLCNFIIEFENVLITGGQMGKIFNARTGDIIYEHHSPLNCAAVSWEDNQFCLVGTYTGEGIVLRKIAGDIVVDNIVSLHKNAIKGVFISKEFVFSVCANAAVALHSIEDFSCYAYIPKAHEKIANGCDGSKEGLFVSVSRDLTLRIWKNENYEIIKTPSSHSIKCVAFDAKNNHISIGNYTGWIGVYDLNENKWILWEKRSFYGISSIRYIQHDFIYSTYDGINEFVFNYGVKYD